MFRVATDKTLRVVPLQEDRRKNFLEVDAGVFSAHLKVAKVHGAISKHYW